MLFELNKKIAKKKDEKMITVLCGCFNVATQARAYVVKERECASNAIQKKRSFENYRYNSYILI